MDLKEQFISLLTGNAVLWPEFLGVQYSFDVDKFELTLWSWNHDRQALSMVALLLEVRDSLHSDKKLSVITYGVKLSDLCYNFVLLTCGRTYCYVEDTALILCRKN